jgi:hypothetical protein
MAQRGLLGFGKMKDFDLDLNSEPFADIPDDEVAGDLEMLMREMGQAPPPAPPPPLPRGCRWCVSAPSHLNVCPLCVCGIVVLRQLCRCVRAGCGGGDATGICVCGLFSVVSVESCLAHTSLTPPRSDMYQRLCAVAFAAVARLCRAAVSSGAFLAMQQRAPWFPATPPLSCTAVPPHTTASLNVMCQTGVADAHPPSPHRAAQRDCRRGLSSLSGGGRWTTASSVPCPLLSAIVMTVFSYSSMPPSLSVATDAVASLAISHCLCTHSRRTVVVGPVLLPFIAQSSADVVTLTAAGRYLLPL